MATWYGMAGTRTEKQPMPGPLEEDGIAPVTEMGNSVTRDLRSRLAGRAQIWGTDVWIRVQKLQIYRCHGRSTLQSVRSPARRKRGDEREGSEHTLVFGGGAGRRHHARERWRWPEEEMEGMFFGR